MNVSWDGVEKKFKALQPRLIWDRADDLEKLANRLMVEKLMALGLKPEPAEHGIGLEGISRELAEKFSRRTGVIEEEARRRGITDPARKADLAVLTREKKVKGVRVSDLEPEWWGRLTPAEKEGLEANRIRLERSPVMDGVEKRAEVTASQSLLGQKDEAWAKRQADVFNGGLRAAAGGGSCDPTEWDRRAIAKAIGHLLERNSVVLEFTVLAEASQNWYLDRTSLKGMRQALAEMALLRKEVDGQVWVTTPEVLAEESGSSGGVVPGVAGMRRFIPPGESVTGA